MTRIAILRVLYHLVEDFQPHASPSFRSQFFSREIVGERDDRRIRWFTFHYVKIIILWCKIQVFKWWRGRRRVFFFLVVGWKFPREFILLMGNCAIRNNHKKGNIIHLLSDKQTNEQTKNWTTFNLFKFKQKRGLKNY